jgi:hypothetical protein
LLQKVLTTARDAGAGLEVAVVAGATAAAKHPELGDGHGTALTNFRLIANAVVKTDEAVSQMAS